MMGFVRSERRRQRLPVRDAAVRVDVPGVPIAPEATLADVDPRGGFGLLFPVIGFFAQAPVSSLWSPWTIRRPSGTVEVVPLFILPVDRRGNRSFRVGTATPSVLSAQDSEAPPFHDERRRHRRVQLSLAYSTTLSNEKDGWNAIVPVRTISDVSVSFDLLACAAVRETALQSLSEVTWEMLFAPGWTFHHREKILPADIRALRRGGTCVARAPGLARRLSEAR